MELKRSAESALVQMPPPKQPRMQQLVAVDPETKKQLMAAVRPLFTEHSMIRLHVEPNYCGVPYPIKLIPIVLVKFLF